MTGKPYDIGVVLVHGIGTAKPGETLVTRGSALLEKMGVTDLTKLEVVLHENPAHVTAVINGKRVKLSESVWGDLIQPPSYLAFLGWCFRAVPTTVVAHYDERYRRTIHRLEQDLPGDPATRDAGTVIRYLSTKRGARTAGSVLLELVILFVGLVLAPVAVTLFGALLIVSYVPGMPKLVNTAKDLLIGYLGDAQVFNDEGIVSRGLRAKVKADFIRMRDESERCIVIAHSQGAAISHDVIRDLEVAQRPCVFISVGSGLRKLKELAKRMKKGEAVGYAWLASSLAGASLAAIMYAGWGDEAVEKMPYVLSYALLLNVIGVIVRMAGYSEQRKKPVWKTKPEIELTALRIRWNWLGFAVITALAASTCWLVAQPADERAAWALAPVLMAASFTYLMQWRYQVGRKTSLAEQRAREEEQWTDYEITDVRWLDVYASSDPVPNGPMLDLIAPDGYHPRPIVNELSMLSDHNAYFAQPDFHEIVLEEIWGDHDHGAVPGAPPALPPPLYQSLPIEAVFRTAGALIAYFLTWLFVATGAHAALCGLVDGISVEGNGLLAMLKPAYAPVSCTVVFAVILYVFLVVLGWLFRPAIREALITGRTPRATVGPTPSSVPAAALEPATTA